MAFRRGHLIIALGSAAVLYAVFLVGHHATSAVTHRAGEQVGRIYELRQAAPLWVIAALLLVIAPAEELFWRGFVQSRLAKRLGPIKGYLIAFALYAGVHAWALNPMLLAAAGLCALAWGWTLLYTRSLWPGIISHIVWDIAIFVIFPVA